MPLNPLACLHCINPQTKCSISLPATLPRCPQSVLPPLLQCFSHPWLLSYICIKHIRVLIIFSTLWGHLACKLPRFGVTGVWCRLQSKSMVSLLFFNETSESHHLNPPCYFYRYYCYYHCKQNTIYSWIIIIH